MTGLNDDGCAINVGGTDWADEPRGVPDQCIRAPKWRVFPAEIDNDETSCADACSEHLGLATTLLHDLHRSVAYLMIRPLPSAARPGVAATPDKPDEEQR